MENMLADEIKQNIALFSYFLVWFSLFCVQFTSLFFFQTKKNKKQPQGTLPFDLKTRIIRFL